MAEVPAIFVSATNAGLRTCREAVRDGLLKRVPAYHPVVEQDFPVQDDATQINRKLHDLIAPCDAVICLLGTGYGGEPSQPLPGHPRQSYSQMEYRMAKTLGKPVFLLIAAPGMVLDDHPVESPETLALQQAFITALTTANTDSRSFTSLEELRQLVPRLNLPKPRSAGLIHNLPFSTLGTLFKGRETFLHSLHASLTGASSSNGTTTAAIIQTGTRTTAPAAIHALGGVGKTRTALEYAWAYQHDYRALLYVSAATPAVLMEQLAALSAPPVFDLPQHTLTELQVKYQAVIQHLRTLPGWLLILDNADTPEACAAIARLQAQLTGGHIIITSRLAHWPAGVQPLELPGLSDDDGAAYLLERTEATRQKTPTDPAQAAALSHRLDGLALALEQAGAYIDRRQCSFAGYLKLLNVSAAEVLRWHSPAGMSYPQSVAETWLTTFQQLTPPEQHLLNILAWFDAQPIPLWMLDHLPATLAFDDPGDTLSTLSAWHLVRRDTQEATFRVHRLVQDVTLHRLLGAKTRREMLNEALTWLDNAKLGNSQDVRHWPRWEPMKDHALRLARHAGEEQQWVAAVLWRNQVAVLLQTKALHAEAEPIYREALATAEAHLPPEHASHVAVLNNLAVLLRATDRLKEAEPLYRRALAIDEKSQGPEHPSVARDLNNLALLLRATGRLKEAEPMYRRALAIDEKSYGPEHPEVAIDLNNLADLLSATDRLTEAELLYRRALSIFEKSYGPEHPNVATSLNNLAGLLRATDRLTEAEPLYRRALAISEKSYGPEHPTVALRLVNLAATFHELNRSLEALPLIQRAVAIFQRSGELQSYVHPHLATARDWLKDIQQAVENASGPS